MKLPFKLAHYSIIISAAIPQQSNISLSPVGLVLAEHSIKYAVLIEYLIGNFSVWRVKI